MACYLETFTFTSIGSACLILPRVIFSEHFPYRNCIMTNVMHKFLIYLSIYFCLTCLGLSVSPSSEAGVQIRQWFKSPGYGVSAPAVDPDLMKLCFRSVFIFCKISSSHSGVAENRYSCTAWPSKVMSLQSLETSGTICHS
jgi:hypothetical protein